MTLVAVWRNYESPEAPQIWAASDSRISNDHATLLDEGVKIFEVPVICRRPDVAGFFTQVLHVGAVGLICAGGTLVYQHVYATLVPILASLATVGGTRPTTSDVADLAAKITTRYVRSLGVANPKADRVSVIVIGADPNPTAFQLERGLDLHGMTEFVPRQLELADGYVHFQGDSIERAKARLAEYQQNEAPGVSRQRAALNVIQSLIVEPGERTIGGDVQLGMTRGASGFRRVASVVAEPGNAPVALRLLNRIDLDELGGVGDCFISVEAMTLPFEAAP